MLSERDSGGGAAPVVRFPQAGFKARMKVDIKSFQLEVSGIIQSLKSIQNRLSNH